MPASDTTARGGLGRIRAGLQAVTIDTAILETATRDAGVAATPTDLGIGPALYGRAIRCACPLRNRYTALDLAAASGMLERFIREETGP